MAEKIQERLELMVSSFNDLKKKGIFSEVEIKTILKKRKGFEFQCQSKPTKKIDFLNYLTFELNLEKLRAKRSSRVASGTKPTLGDFSIQRHIYNLFERTLFKFKGDVNLWLQYISFAKSQKAKAIVQKAFIKALRLLPTSVVLWSAAASYEFSENLNMDAARALLQRGIRLNSESKTLWLEYFRLEAMYLNKLRLRKKMLGLEGDKEIKEREEGDEEGETGDNLLLELNGIGEDAGNVADETLLQQMDFQDPLLSGDVLKFIYNHATKKFPEDLKFRTDFLNLYKHFDDSQGVQFILDGLTEEFENEPEVINAAITLKVPDLESSEYLQGLKSCIQQYEEKIIKDEVYGLIQFYIKFLIERFAQADEPNLEEYLKLKLKQNFAKFFNQFSIKSPKTLPTDFYIEFVKFMKREFDDEKTALKVVKVAVKCYPEVPELYKLNFYLLDDDEDKKQLLHKGLQILATKNIFDTNLWKLYLDLVTGSEDNDHDHDDHEEEEGEGEQTEKLGLDYDQLMNCLKKLQTGTAAQSEQDKEARDSVKSTILQKSLQITFKHKGIELVRLLETKLSSFTTLSPQFYLTWIDLELQHHQLCQHQVDVKAKKVKLGNDGLSTFQDLFVKDKRVIANDTFDKCNTIFINLLNRFNLVEYWLEYLKFLKEFDSTTNMSKLMLKAEKKLDKEDLSWLQYSFKSMLSKDEDNDDE